MSIPKNPESVILTNVYYPKGLRESQIWNHYQKYKNWIIEGAKGRSVVVFLIPNINDIIVIRKLKGNNIVLSLDTYDKVISGRTISFAYELGKVLEYYVIDIDYNSGVSESSKKDFLELVLDFYKTLPEVIGNKIYLSSSGYHVYGYLEKKMDYRISTNVLKKKMNYYFKDQCSIDSKNKDKFRINLDLSPMKNGACTVPFALNRNGLICYDVTNNYLDFDRKQAVTK